jgi:rubredoxin
MSSGLSMNDLAFLSLLDAHMERFYATHDWHEHQCESCGWVWTHIKREGDRVSEETAELHGIEAGDQAYHERHNCPGCGQNQRQIKRWVQAPNGGTDV